MNPLQRGGAFQFTLANPNPTSSKTKEGPVYRVSFELTQEEWQWFMDAETKGMVIEVYHAEVTHENGAPAEPEPPSVAQEPDPAPPVAAQEEKPKGGALSKSAAMICQDPEFQRYIGQATLAIRDSEGVTRPRRFPGTDTGAREAILACCRIPSRSLLDHDAEAKAAFIRLMGSYRTWREKEGLPT